MVYAIHPLPARDLTGTARGTAKFPDDGHGYDGYGGGERIVAR